MTGILDPCAPSQFLASLDSQDLIRDTRRARNPREKGATPSSTTPSTSPKRFPGASRMLSRGRVVLDDFLAGAVPAISYHTGTIGLDHHRRHIPIGIASNGHDSLFA